MKKLKDQKMYCKTISVTKWQNLVIQELAKALSISKVQAVSKMLQVASKDNCDLSDTTIDSHLTEHVSTRYNISFTSQEIRNAISYYFATYGSFRLHPATLKEIVAEIHHMEIRQQTSDCIYGNNFLPYEITVDGKDVTAIIDLKRGIKISQTFSFEEDVRSDMILAEVDTDHQQFTRSKPIVVVDKDHLTARNCFRLVDASTSFPEIRFIESEYSENWDWRSQSMGYENLAKVWIEGWLDDGWYVSKTVILDLDDIEECRKDFPSDDDYDWSDIWLDNSWDIIIKILAE